MKSPLPATMLVLFLSACTQSHDTPTAGPVVSHPAEAPQPSLQNDGSGPNAPYAQQTDSTGQPPGQGDAGASDGYGQGNGSGQGPGSRPGVRFPDADANGDRRLSRDEAKAIPFVSRRFDELDSNHDGFVTREELRAGRQHFRALREQRQAGHLSGGASTALAPATSDDDH